MYNHETNISISLSDSEAFLCLPAIFAAISLRLASSRALAAAGDLDDDNDGDLEFTVVWLFGVLILVPDNTTDIPQVKHNKNDTTFSLRCNVMMQ